MTSEFEEIGNWFLLRQVPYTRNKEYKKDKRKDDGKFRLGFYFINYSWDTVVDTHPCTIYKLIFL